jgi:energy-coupling factor transport system ATP-binding protein
MITEDIIAIEGLTYRFEGGAHDALRDVTLCIAPGEFVVVTGPSGCGKSTLALAIGGYLYCQYDGQARGTVTVAGMDVRESPIYDVAEAVGLVQQNPEAQFCTLTVRDEVAFGLENRCLPRAEIQERIAWALSIVEAEHLADRSLATLSGGEKQKVAIAAMMAAKPQILIFDEPTSNLDPSATAEVFEVIAHIRAKAGITVLVIEHKVDYLLPFEPRLLVMDRGSIVYDGSYDGFPRPTAERPKRALPAPDTTGKPVVRLEGACLGYNGSPVLQDLSLSVWPGDFVAVMGDNGSGKTTFLQSLIGLLKPEEGKVEVFDEDTRRSAVSVLARQVGFVFQNPDHQLFADSVWQEAVFALRNFDLLDDAARVRACDLLSYSGLGERGKDHPYRLSYGQKRRLNLISVLGYAPVLILLDEVLIGQDQDNATFLLDLVRQRAEQGSAVVMVNHAPKMTRDYANRVLFFEGGKIIVDAPPEQAFGQLKSLGKVHYVA